MNFLRKITDFVTGKDRVRSHKDSSECHEDGDCSGPRKQQRRYVHRQQPLLTDSPKQGGGVQGLSWYFNALKRDEDGDEAHEFVREEPEEIFADCDEEADAS